MRESSSSTSRQSELAPALPVGAGEQVVHATRGFNKSPMAHLLAFAPSGRGLAVVDTPVLGWRRNGHLQSMRSDDDDNDDDDDYVVS